MTPFLRSRRPADARRGLYVDVTRARENVTIAYGKDDLRDNGKTLVRDVEQQLEVARQQSRAIHHKYSLNNRDRD